MRIAGAHSDVVSHLLFASTFSPGRAGEPVDGGTAIPCPPAKPSACDDIASSQQSFISLLFPADCRVDPLPRALREHIPMWGLSSPFLPLSRPDEQGNLSTAAQRSHAHQPNLQRATTSRHLGAFIAPLHFSHWERGIVDPLPRASREHILIVRPRRAKGLTMLLSLSPFTPIPAPPLSPPHAPRTCYRARGGRQASAPLT